MGTLSGFCKQCGFCCRNVQFVIPATPDALEWAKARGIQRVQSNENFIELRFPQLCINYQSDGKCSIQREKPHACEKFPRNMLEFWEKHGMNPMQSLGPQCGFTYKE